MKIHLPDEGMTPCVLGIYTNETYHKKNRSVELMLAHKCRS